MQVIFEVLLSTSLWTLSFALRACKCCSQLLIHFKIGFFFILFPSTSLLSLELLLRLSFSPLCFKCFHWGRLFVYVSRAVAALEATFCVLSKIITSSFMSDAWTKSCKILFPFTSQRRKKMERDKSGNQEILQITSVEHESNKRCKVEFLSLFIFLESAPEAWRDKRTICVWFWAEFYAPIDSLSVRLIKTAKIAIVSTFYGQFGAVAVAVRFIRSIESTKNQKIKSMCCSVLLWKN